MRRRERERQGKGKGMLDWFNRVAATPAYNMALFWVLCLLVVNAIIRIGMYFINREIIGNLILTASSMTQLLAIGIIFVRLPGVYTAEFILYLQSFVRFISFLVAIGLAVAGWALTFKLIKVGPGKPGKKEEKEKG